MLWLGFLLHLHVLHVAPMLRLRLGQRRGALRKRRECPLIPLERRHWNMDLSGPEWDGKANI